MNRFLKNSAWFIAFFLVISAWILGLFIDLTGDAGLYAAITRRMVESGDWLNLTMNGEPYEQKPHLLFWLAGTGIQWLGNANAAFKLFPVLFGLSGLFFTYRLGRLVFSERAGRLALLMAGTSQIFFLYLLDIHTDTVLQAGVTLAMWQFTAYLKNKRLISFLTGFAGIGLAMMTKGPVGAVLPVLFLFFYFVRKKDLRQFFHPRWLAGILITVIIISPALYHLYQNFGMEGLRFYFIDNNVGRITGEVAGSNSDPFYYLYNLLWAFLPWTVPVFVGLFAEVKSWFHPKTVNKFSFSMLVSVLTLLLIYSISRGKAPNYLLIMIPLIAVVAAGQIDRHLSLYNAIPRSFVYVQSVVLLLLVLVFFASAFLTEKADMKLPALFLVMGSFLVVLFIRTESQMLNRMIFITLVVSAFFNLFLNGVVIPGLFRYQGARQALLIYESQRSDEGLLKNLHLEEYELFFQADAPVEKFSTWEDFYAFLGQEEPWVYTNDIGYEVVMELVSQVDTVYVIPQRGMNEMNLAFLMPATRGKTLNEHYLIKIR